MPSLDLIIDLELSIGQPLGQLRAKPLNLARDGAARAILACYGADYDVDPWHEMFFYPTDTLKFHAFTPRGQTLWKKDLGRGVVPGMWFCPILTFDLDGDGADEVWFVNNPDAQHPLGISQYQLTRLDPHTGAVTGAWQWPNYGGQQVLSHMFRNFIFGGFVHGKPVLVTAQGTYEGMFLQAYNSDMTLRWRIQIAREAPGARGTHSNPVVDINGDGIDEVMWGERCISLDTGEELFCADRDVYSGHSDLVQPCWDRTSRRWLLYSFRESDRQARPRVVVFDHQGKRLWGAVDEGHMDMGWVARLGDNGEQTATTIRIGAKKSGPDGHVHEAREEFAFDLLTGRPLALPFVTYQTLPADLNGDGLHELVRGIYKGNGEVLDRHGHRIGQIRGQVAMAYQFTNHPGEQLLTHQPDGTVRIWRDQNAHDTEPATARFQNRFYRNTSNQRNLAGV